MSSTTTANVRNEYLEQVARQGRQLEQDLRPRKKMMLANTPAQSGPSS